MSWDFNPFTGTFDYTSESAGAVTVADASKRLQITKTMNENILKGDLIKMDTATSCSKANVDTTDNASVVGIALADYAIGTEGDILILGIFEDAMFASIPLGASVFQDNLGQLTINATTIVGEFFCRVGKSYGNGTILIKPEEPVEVA